MIEFYEIAELVRNDSVKVRNDSVKVRNDSVKARNDSVKARNDNIKVHNDRNRVRNDILSVMLNLIQHLKNNLLPQTAAYAHVWQTYPSCQQYNRPLRGLYRLWRAVETRAALGQYRLKTQQIAHE